MSANVPTENVSKLLLGTAPDSWGVWFPTDPQQVTWNTYLDEVANAGYVWTELGPQGFLPQDPAQLRDELASRGLKVCGGTVFAGLHKGKEALDKAIAEFSQEAKLLSEVGAKYLVHLPEQYTDMHTGAATEAGELDPEEWSNLITGTNELGKIIYEEYGVELVFHPHADTHLDTQERILRFLDETDPTFVNLCLDTGHVAYCDGDNLRDHRAGARPDHLRAPQVRRPEGPRTGQGREAVAGRGRAARRDGRAAVRRARGAAAAGRAGPARPGDLHHPGTGPLPGRAAHPTGHPGPRRRLPHRLRARSGPPLAELTRSCRTAILVKEQNSMVKIALDPAMYHADLSVADEVRKAAELGYEYLELSPRPDFFFWHRYPKADDAAIAEVKKACKETGVTLLTLVPVFNWSSPDEQERQAQVRNWRRLLQIAAELECPVVNSELSGDPN